MPKSRKPSHTPATPFPTDADSLHEQDNWIWIPLRKEWRDKTAKPEEVVRQRFVRTLVQDYGYTLEQMDQERRTQHGHKSPRADIVVWESAADKQDNRTPVLVIECKTDTIQIQERDYYQGESYARATACEFFVATNVRHTTPFKLVPGLPGEFVAINEIPKASDWGNAKRLKEIREKLRTFNRKEFQDLLFDCHCILRDVHKMDPGRAFDTISKILFIKMYVERSGLHGTFTTEFLDLRKKAALKNEVSVHDGLFDSTKDYYRADELFAETDKLDISEDTFRRIVKLLERFDLSKTGDDIKGLAFEKFLGTTFRGELGQYFTPRPIVNFMVELLNPREKELICDPASGSGGFLIRAFEHVRDQITAEIQQRKDNERARIEALNLPQEDEERQIAEAFSRLNQELLPSDDENKPADTRVGRLAWECIFGTDAEPRAARTAKMNMIMHGDGHGGIHYHDGLLDLNGIFAGRFDLVFTNPPFGANVGADQKVGGSEETRVPTDAEYVRRCKKRYGSAWEAAWTQAHSDLDSRFNKQRDELHAKYDSRIVSGDSEKTAKLLAKLNKLGVSRTLPAWEHGAEPSYPRSIGPTVQGKPLWTEEVSDKNKKPAATLKQQANAALSAAQKVSSDLLSELKAKYRAIDVAQNAALWARVRELCNYPVFIAAPKSVGITTTGETGDHVPNDLPALLNAYRDFEAWVSKGAKPEETPNFPLPSAA